MRKAVLISISLSVLSISAEVQSISWLRQFGTAAEDAGSAVAADASGIYVVGNTRGRFAGQSKTGRHDAFIRKYNAGGSELWTRQFGAPPRYHEPQSTFARGVTAHLNAIYVVGHTTGTLPGQSSSGGTDGFIRKYDASGNELWTRQFGRSYGYDVLPHAVTADATGIYVLGVILGPLPKGAEFYPTLWKYDASGNKLWAIQFDENAWGAYYFGITADVTGIYIVGRTYEGSFVWKYDSNGTQLWERNFATGINSPDGIIAADATGIYVAHASGDSLLRKYDTDGNTLWRRAFGPEVGVAGLGSDATGIYVVGRIRGSGDVFVRKYDSSFNELWSSRFYMRPESFAAYMYLSVATDGANVYVVGNTTRPDQLSEAFLARFERTTGTPVASVLSRNPALTNPRTITTDGSTLFIGNRSALPDRSNLFSMPIAGGPVTSLYNGLRNPLGITTLGNNLFWIDPDSGPLIDTQILTAPKNGGGPFRPIYTGSATGQPIVDGSGVTTDGASLFTVDAFHGRVHRLNPDGSGLTLLGSRFGGGAETARYQQMDESEGTLYIADAGRPGIASPGVFSLPGHGGTFMPLHVGAPFVCPSGIAVRDGSLPGAREVFVADPCANTLWGLPRTGGMPMALLSGAPFVSIDGLAFDKDVLYATDSGNKGGVDGPGAIYRILPRLCDTNWDANVDDSDIGEIFAARSGAASGPNDPRDMDGDGFITVDDARKCALLCTKPNCTP